MLSVKSKYDEQGRVIEEIHKEYGGEAITTNRYQGNRLVAQETTISIGKPRPKSWSYWTYDRSGKLIEYRRGSGETIQNHDTKFKRDEQGRLTSFEYRQGDKDELFSRTEFKYSRDGKTVDMSTSFATGGSNSNTQTLDERGSVAKVVFREQDWRTKKPKAPVTVILRYDGQGRLVEQLTDDPDFEPAGSENSLPPGKVSITYDDAKHQKSTVYYSKEGTLAATVTYDSTGVAIGLSFEAGSESMDMKLKCASDGHDNWTACQQVVHHAGVTKITKKWRRTITYR